MLFANDWDEILEEELEKTYFKDLVLILEEEYKNKVIYPPKNKIFNALKLCSFENTKVVIIGQDPYHGENQAEGLAFSVQEGLRIPPSLNNIFKELKSDLNIDKPNHGSLIQWSKEGVLLLNAVLTVEKDKAASHSNLAWAIFTDAIIKILNANKEKLVFILWGNFAKSKESLINKTKHLVISSNHPSPLSASRGFFGSKPFSKTNEFLKKNKLKEINWKIKE